AGPASPARTSAVKRPTAGAAAPARSNEMPTSTSPTTPSRTRPLAREHAHRLRRRAVEGAGRWTARADRRHPPLLGHLSSEGDPPGLTTGLGQPHGGCPHLPQPRRRIEENENQDPRVLWSRQQPNSPAPLAPRTCPLSAGPVYGFSRIAVRFRPDSVDAFAEMRNYWTQQRWTTFAPLAHRTAAALIRSNGLAVGWYTREDGRLDALAAVHEVAESAEPAGGPDQLTKMVGLVVGHPGLALEPLDLLWQYLSTTEKG